MRRSRNSAGQVFCVSVVLAAVSLVALVTWGTQASAHSDLLGTSPAPGERYAPPLERVELQFDETVTFPDIKLVTPDGRTISGLLSSPRQGNIRATLAEPETVPGTWTVIWEVQSPDGDATEGEFTFGLSSDGRELEALPETLVATGLLGGDGEPRSPLFLIALGITIALAALMIWAGFDALSRRIRATNERDATEGDATERGD